MATETEELKVLLEAELGNWSDVFANAQKSLDNFKKKLKDVENSTNGNGFSKIADRITSVTSTVSQKASAIGDTFIGLGSTILGATTGITASVGLMAKNIIETSADIQVIDAQYSQVFQGIEKQAQDSANRMSKAWNVIPERLKEPMSAFQSFYKAVGKDAPDALKSTERALTIVADASAFYDRSLEDTQASLKGFLMGNYENGDALGINTNLTKIATAYNKKYGGSFEELSDQAQQDWLLEYIENIYKVSGVTGQATRESNNWSNVLGNLQTKFKYLVSYVGKPFLQPLLDNLNRLTPVFDEVGDKIKAFMESAKGKEVIKSFSDVLGVLVDALIRFIKDINIESIAESMKKFLDGFTKGDTVGTVEKIVKAIQSFINQLIVLAKIIVPLLPTLIQLAPKLIAVGVGFKAVGVVSSVVGGLVQFANGISKVFQFVKSGQLLTQFASGFTALGTAIGAISTPVLIVVGVITALVGAFVLAYTKSEQFRTFVNQAWTSIAQTATQVFTQLKDTLTQVWTEISTTVSSVVSTLVSWLQGVFSTFTSWYNANQEEIKAIVTVAWNVISAIIQSVVGFIADTIRNTWDTIKGVTQGAWQIISTTIETFINIVLSVIQIFIGVFTGDWSKAWEGAKTLVSSAWEGIKGTVSGAMKILATVVSSGLKTVLTFFQNFPLDVARKIGAFGQQLYESGAKIVQQIANGIKGAIHVVENAISSVTEKIRRFLPFSPAKEGALRDLNKLNFGGTISEGIYNGKKEVMKAMDDLTTFPQLENIGSLTMQSDITSTFKGQSFKGALGHNNTVIQTVVNLDGRQIAIAQAPYTQEQLDILNNRNNRLYGI